jgi:ribonuclease BN (tRNA processing enzyme)
MRIIPLGVNGFVPTFGRHTTSFLVLNGSDAILLDAGTGIARLFDREISQLLEPYERLHIVLSHYHLDHVVGLSYMAGICADRSICIHAPSPPLVEADPFDALHALLRPPFFSLPLDQFPMRVDVEPITGKHFAVGNSLVSVRPQIHPGGSIGIRIEDLVFMTDTAVDASAASFINGAKLLLHEIWLRDEDAAKHPNELIGHSFLGGVVNLALKAEADQMMPIHLHPGRSADDLERLGDAIENTGIRFVRPTEGAVYDIG